MRRDDTVDELIGTSIGNYKIVKKLGEGGMGAVYLGEHATIGSRVAVKVLHPEYARRKQIVDRFFAEAQSVNKIRHENIVQIVDLSQLPDGSPYLIMEYLEGRALSAALEGTRGLELGLALAIGAQICDALAAAHEHRIVHRDLKPDNVFLQPRKRGAPHVKLLDFGIAKLLDDGGSMPGATRTGSILGTPRYMSPEQASGHIKEIDWRSDIYSFGVILFELCTGRPPFESEAFGELMIKHVTQPPPAPRTIRLDLPESIEAIILRCLAKDKTARFQRMDEVGDLLRGELERLGGAGTFPGLRAGTGAVPPAAAHAAGSVPSYAGPRTGTGTGGAGATMLARHGGPARTAALAAGLVLLLGGAGFAGMWALRADLDADADVGKTDDDATGSRGAAKEGAAKEGAAPGDGKPAETEPPGTDRERIAEGAGAGAGGGGEGASVARGGAGKPASGTAAAGGDPAGEPGKPAKAPRKGKAGSKSVAGVAKDATGVKDDAVGVGKGAAGVGKGAGRTAVDAKDAVKGDKDPDAVEEDVGGVAEGAKGVGKGAVGVAKGALGVAKGAWGAVKGVAKGKDSKPAATSAPERAP